MKSYARSMVLVQSLWCCAALVIAVSISLGCSKSDSGTTAATERANSQESEWLPAPDGAPSNLVAMYVDAQMRVKRNDPAAYAKMAEASFNVVQYASQRDQLDTAAKYSMQASRALRMAIDKNSPGLPNATTQAAVFFSAAGAYATSGEFDKAISDMQTAAELGLPLAQLEKLERDAGWSGVRQQAGYQDQYKVWLTAAMESEISASRRREAIAFGAIDFSGNPFNTSQLAGKPTVLFVWGSWSEAATQMLPDIAKLADEGVQVVGIMYEDEENAELKLAAAERAVRELGISFPTLIGSEEVTAAIRQFVPLKQFPAVLYVDSQGVVRHTTAGVYSLAYLQAASISVAKL